MLIRHHLDQIAGRLDILVNNASTYPSGTLEALQLEDLTASIGINVVGTVFSTFLAILVTFFVSLYMTMDAPRISDYFHSLFPTNYRSELADLLRRIWLVSSPDRRRSSPARWFDCCSVSMR